VPRHAGVRSTPYALGVLQRPTEDHSPESRERADVLVRRLTRSAVLVATGATVLVGVIVAKEHPGASAGARATETTLPRHPTTSTPTAPSKSSPTSSRPPTTTTRRPVATSGGTSR
jgi:cytoskeletal protein RodZ